MENPIPCLHTQPIIPGAPAHSGAVLGAPVVHARWPPRLPMHAAHICRLRLAPWVWVAGVIFVVGGGEGRFGAFNKLLWSIPLSEQFSTLARP